MKNQTERGKRKLPSDTKLFRFTREDERLIRLAMIGSVCFMSGYGKGRTKAGRTIIDYGKYD